MTDINMFGWEMDEAGIVTLTMDDPTASVNTMNELFLTSLPATLDRLEAEKDKINGVVLTSAKKTFFAGANLDLVLKATPEDAAQWTAMTNDMKALFRRLETLGRPVVAAINGAALGAGLELALACHHRVALDVKGSTIGLPEVNLGLLPGGGGIVRTVRMFGIQTAIMNHLLQGQQRKPKDALAAGVVDEVVSTPEEMMHAAKTWALSNLDAAQPWDVKGYKIPGGTPTTPSFAANLPAFPANLRKQIKGAPMPAPLAIMAAAVEGAQVDFANAERIETEYFVGLATGPVSKNMIQAFFFDMQHISKGGDRPKDVPKYTAKKVVVLGAGMMGAGIAYECARAGMEVVLKDVSLASAEKGKAYSQGILDKAVSRGKMTAEARDEILARILPTENMLDAKGADLMIEAVFEDPALKKAVYAEVVPLLTPDALLGSNTSSLPVTGLAEGVDRPEDFIGLHFFSPVDKMKLLEIVVGKKTSDEALAKAIDVAVQIRKLPIVVNDSRGFFTSRVIGTVVTEAAALVGEGVPANSVEQAALQAGYPVGQLALTDEVSLTLALKIKKAAEAEAAAGGLTLADHPGYPVIEKLVTEHNRGGRAAGAGFYDYAEGKKLGLWPGLKEVFGGDNMEIPFKDLQDRMLFIEVIESIKCLDENVLRTVPDANIGSIFGIGFPAWSGGVFQIVNTYDGVGPKAFVARARELAEKYGERFTPPASLVAMAEAGGTYQ
ncbi:MAG: 3-hydroxyacyl-CoA dehydrogenase NAD-binding domain-containing protein [Candidatus Nanopelagicales bacterium]|jgi:3-hydroxyacyl-CoA dehydrogenase/enoyl-CoA hydratase/3-hydroxybutyryl-CoA epimerase|nr:3-hydroxyacyl-CoA dehydrogenase NAD-binding domain-containing protein [Candidatus Nanopelagicales bacterium]